MDITRLWETLGEYMGDAQKYFFIAVDPHTSKKSCLGFLKLLKKQAERIDHVCGRLIEETEHEHTHTHDV